MAAAYGVLTTYGMAEHNKWLYGCNTETNDLLDAPARGSVAAPEKAARATQYRRMSYNLRDIIYMAARVPDKALGRTMIHPYQSPTATAVTFNLLKHLRGRLVEVAVDDDRIYAVASIDKTNPRALNPSDPSTQSMVVVVFNDHRSPRTIDLNIAAPPGTSFSAGEQSIATLNRETFDIGLTHAPVAGGTNSAFQITLQERTAAVVRLPFIKPIDRERPSDLIRQQAFGQEILQKVSAGQPATINVPIDADLAKGAQRAWLRVVVEQVDAGEATVQVGEQRIDLPVVATSDNVCRIFDLPVDLEQVQGDSVQVVGTVNGPQFNGYRLASASIMFERAP